MVGKDRVFALTQMRCKAELMAYFEVASWPLCAAFQWDELVFANISRVADGAPEFAVIRSGQHLANLPLSRLSRRAVCARLDQLVADSARPLGTVHLRLEPATQHRCRLCAAWCWS